MKLYKELETEDNLEVWAVTDEEMDCREHTSYFRDYDSAKEYFEKLKQEFLEGGYYKELHEEYPEEKFIMEDEDDYFYFLNDVAGLNSYCITMGKIF